MDVTTSKADRTWNPGVRARLLLAFFAICAFAVLAAAAGTYAFREVGARLDIVDTRVPPTVSSLELTRSAERIIAAAPALLAATDRRRRDEIKAQLAAEVERLGGKLIELKSEGTQSLPLEEIEPVVSLLTASLAQLDDAVARRLDASERLGALRSRLFQTNAEAQRLIAPWIEVTAGEISAHVADQGAGERAASRLASLIEAQRLIQTAQRQVSAAADMLAEASTSEQAARLPILDFQLGLALRELDATAAGLDPMLRPLFLEEVAKLRGFVDGPDAIAAARRQELALIEEGGKRLAASAGLSARLASAVDRLGVAAKRDIDEAIGDALSAQRLGTRALIGLVALSLVTSVLIVWLYVGGNIVRRLTALSDGMLAIAGGKLDTPVAARGADEIAAMGRAVEVFRQNAIELERLLEERKHAAARLEHMVEERTHELSEALEQQKATAEILRVISTSPTDAQPVFETIVKNAVSLCGSLFANVFRFDGEWLHFVAAHNVGADYVDLLRTKYPMRPDPSQVSGRVLLTKSVVRIADVLADPDYDQRFPVAMGWRRMLGVPMLRDGNPVGVVVVGWAEPGPISTAEEELLKTFADQAVIAIENARLFDEVQARTRDLSESLQQQTATADVLKIISRSTFDLQTVLDTLTESAAQLCEADMAGITRPDSEGRFHYATNYKFASDWLDTVNKIRFERERGSVVGRVLATGRALQIADVLADPEYAYREQAMKAGFRTFLGVPLVREGKPIGVLVLGRKAIRPFTDKQIELLTTFADQAVIAIENARLFDEIQEKTRQLEIADKYKSHFLASASHDLRQPLHALNLFVAQLRAEPDPAERARLTGRIDAAVASMNELFEALLDMTKLEAGILEPNPSEFPVARLFDRIETTFGDATAQKGLRLSVVPSGAWVRSDFILLERILMNLVSNAVRYTAQGGVVVGCRRRDGRLRIDVCDSGPGIPHGQQQEVFGEYYRLAETRGDGGGLGLGLAIVDRLGRLLDHAVELRSLPGRGSRFSVWVPLAAGRRTADAAASPAVFADPARGKLVVVIDDDALVLEGMGGILRSWGCTVATADCEEAALSGIAAQHRRPDLIISDYRLAGGRTGIEAIERLRGALGAPIPAFLISGDTAPERLREASEKGFHLLHKPVTPMRLRAMLNQLLKSRPAVAAE